MRLLLILFGIGIGLLTASVCPYVRKGVHDGAYAALGTLRHGVAHVAAADHAR